MIAKLLLTVVLASTLRFVTAKSYYRGLTSPLASAVCGQLELYEETGIMQPSLHNAPLDIALLADGSHWVWKCTKEKCTKIEYQKDVTNQRVLGGYAAGNTEFPWDVSIRFIYDWGRFWPEPRKKEDVAANNFLGLKESHRCTGTLYSRRFVLTSAWCAERGKEYIRIKNRFVMWIARGRFLDAKMIENTPGQKKKGDIYTHPEFDADPDSAYTKDHDIAILKMPTPFKFSKEVHALQIAPKHMSFVGQTAVFTGWGTTFANLTGSMLGNPGMKPAFGSKLYKLKLTVMPFEGDCEDVIQQNLEVHDNYNPNDNFKERYLCARTDVEGAGACGGDIGGPLICTDHNTKKNYLCGLRNAWALVTKCPSKHGLEIFVRPSYYLQWMEKVAGKQNPKELRQG